MIHEHPNNPSQGSDTFSSYFQHADSVNWIGYDGAENVEQVGRLIQSMVCSWLNRNIVDDEICPLIFRLQGAESNG